MIPARRLPHLIAIAMLAVVLASCAARPPREDLEAQERQALALLAEGRPAEAGALYMQLAERAAPPEAERLRLKAIEAVLTPATLDLARSYLGRLDERALDTTDLARSRLARARLQLLEGRPALALETLPTLLPGLPRELEIRIRRTGAEASAQAGMPREAAEQRLVLDALLASAEERAANQDALWADLSQATSYDLFSWSAQATSGLLKGWLDLAYIAKTTPPKSAALETQLARWLQAYPQHPASPRMLERLRGQWKEYETYPTDIAVLLPLTGKFAAVAEAVLNGVLAAYYADVDETNRPTLRVYDIGERPTDVWSHYSRAVQDGAQFVIGPLDKAAVGVLGRMENLPAPVLALNYGDEETAPSPEGLYQFGLLPEDEARQVAERISLAGHGHAVAFVPEGEWGARILATFKERFELLGGQVLAAERYTGGSGTDYSAAILRAFGLNESETRHRQVRTTIKEDVKFEPRRRQDVDVVFIAGSPRQARSLKPQLEFHRATGLPVYATSHAYSGIPDPRSDRDLNGLIYCDMPWVLPQATRGAALREQTESTLPEANRQFVRLVALGVDAYRIVPYLKRLAAQPHERFEGVTGNVRVDEQRRLHRDLNWARFERGVPRLLTGGDLGEVPQGPVPDAETEAR